MPPAATPTDFSVSVIGGDRPYRGSRLKSLLAQNSSRLIHHPNPWLTPGPENQEFLDDRAARLIWGRSITLGEVGCSLSHRYAYDAGLKTESEWLLVLEDDADPDPDFFDVITEIIEAYGSTSQPTIINLDVVTTYARGARGIGRHVSEGGELVELKYPLPNASAYLINRTAMAIALSAPWVIVCPPDWPPWSMQVKFVTTTTPIITTLVGESTIQDRPLEVSTTAKIKRLLAILSGENWRRYRSHYLSFRSFLRYEFGFRLLGSIRLRFRKSSSAHP